MEVASECKSVNYKQSINGKSNNNTGSPLVFVMMVLLVFRFFSVLFFAVSPRHPEIRGLHVWGALQREFLRRVRAKLRSRLVHVLVPAFDDGTNAG